MAEANFVCHVCGQSHDGVPPSFAADFPDMYASLSETDRGSRALISSDQCVIDEQWFFIRGCLEIPILESDGVFLWGLWASVKEEAFNEISAGWEEEGRERRLASVKARLANSLSVYPETINLKLRIVIQPVGTRPLFILEEEHPLAAAQQRGMSRRDAAELSAELLHMPGPWSRTPQ